MAVHFISYEQGDYNPFTGGQAMGVRKHCCTVCGGYSRSAGWSWNDHGLYDGLEVCPDCVSFYRKLTKKRCAECNGSGRSRTDRFKRCEQCGGVGETTDEGTSVIAAIQDMKQSCVTPKVGEGTFGPGMGG